MLNWLLRRRFCIQSCCPWAFWFRLSGLRPSIPGQTHFLCCGLGAFAIWVRPTHAAYGLSAILMASLVLGMRRRSISEIASGTALWLASFTLLAWTNCVRFGSPLEFGHRLTVSSGTMMYLIRFGNPYHEAPLFQAAKELFGLLFLANPRGEYAFADNQFPGQSPFTRWRKLDFTTFDSTYAVVCLIVIVVAGFWLIRRRKQIALWRKPQGPVILCLLSWSGLSTIMMGVFYLHYPIIASRYLLDFAPAFAGFVMLACVLLRDNWARFLFPLVAVWLVCEIALAKVPAAEQYPNQPIRLMLPCVPGAVVENFDGIYTPDNPPNATGIPGNGYGWDPESGIAANIVSLAVDRPQFVELHVSQRRASNGESMGNDVYRAQIDGVSLQQQEVVPAADGLTVRFDLPKSIRSQQQEEVLFLGFSSGFSEADRDSERFLYSVRWR